MEKIGLIAGNRNFPLLFASEARKKGACVVAIAIKKDTSPRLNSLVDKVYWLGLGDFGRMFEIFKQEGITKVVMAGQVSPRRLFSKEVEKSEELKKILAAIENKKADTIFAAIAESLRSAGLELLDSTTFVQEHLPKKGTLTRAEPGAGTWEDINFGLGLAKEIARLDIGQSIAIKNKAVVGVEALEGTDNLIRRAAKIASAGVTIIKVSKPKQDMRFDIPVVGLATVKNLVKARAACLAFEAGKTLFLDKEEALELADRKGIVIAAV